MGRKLNKLTYADCERLLAKRDEKRIGNNTTLRRVGNDFAIRLHSTDVVTIHADGTYTLNSGGWHTVTSQNRMSVYVPALCTVDGSFALCFGNQRPDRECQHFRCFRKRGGYYIGFLDGMRFDGNGRLQTAEAVHA